MVTKKTYLLKDPKLWASSHTSRTTKKTQKKKWPSTFINDPVFLEYDDGYF